MSDKSSAEWTPAALRAISAGFEARSPAEVLRWGAATFGGDLAMATGFGPEGIVLMHLASQIDRGLTIFYLDTDLLFKETYELRDELQARLGVKFTRVHGGLSVAAQAEAHGPELWKRHPDECCALRKVKPLRAYLATKEAWITGIRRDQTANRATAGLVEWDRSNGLVKLNPLAGWTSRQVWSYLSQHGLPYNRLHAIGYPSIGCQPCTRPAAEGADERSGRWMGLAKTECGIHLHADELPALAAG